MNIFKNYFYNDIMNLMIIGKYDNQYQIYRNQTNGRLNSKYGGHEYVNVPIKHYPIESNALIAAYYLNNYNNNNNCYALPFPLLLVLMMMIMMIKMMIFVVIKE